MAQSVERNSIYRPIITVVSDDTITIPREEYDTLVKKSAYLAVLMASVDAKYGGIISSVAGAVKACMNGGECDAE